MRLFTGIPLPDEIVQRLSDLLTSLRPTARLNWSPPANLHITTKFIGEWPEDRLPQLIDTLQRARSRSPIEISVSGLGWFPNPHSPRIFFAAVRASSDLERLAIDTNELLAGIGIEKESKSFKPHLTLARIKDSSVPLAPLRQAIAGLPDTGFGRFRASAFHLYLSKPGPTGSVYTQLAEFPLNP